MIAPWFLPCNARQPGFVAGEGKSVGGAESNYVDTNKNGLHLDFCFTSMSAGH